MPLFLLFCVAMNAGAWIMLRRGVPLLAHRNFDLLFPLMALVALVPWGALAVQGFKAMDETFGRASLLVWSMSIAWHVAVAVLVCSWVVWRPLMGLLNGRMEETLDPERRQLLSNVGALVPLGAMAFGAAGVAAAGFKPFVRRVEMSWPDLPEALHGFKIGQFTDIHVGPFVAPSQVASGIAALNEAGVDVMVMTGDLLDDVNFMPAINEAFATCKAPHGLVGILGNHEYYAGLDSYVKQARQGPMTLLVDEHLVLDHKGTRLFIAGLDYPFHGLDGHAGESTASIKKALKARQDGDFTLCLAHHPTCWDAAREHGVHLTLAGHTHGGQVAVAGRSIFAKLFKYMLGEYQDGASRLFVSGGLGHWFPFRLGCPPEVVVVELRRGDARPA